MAKPNDDSVAVPGSATRVQYRQVNLRRRFRNMGMCVAVALFASFVTAGEYGHLEAERRAQERERVLREQQDYVPVERRTSPTPAEAARLSTELKQALAAAAGSAIGAATGEAAGAASGLVATANNYLTATDLRSKAKKLKECRSQDSAQCEVNVLIEYDLKSARNSDEIRHKTVLR